MFLAVHQSPDATLGVLADRLPARGIPVEVRTRLAAADLDRSDLHALLLVEGGGSTLDVADADDTTLGVLRTAVERGLPVLGVGPGAQLLALALGGEVADRERPEVGIAALSRTVPGREDAVVAGWPDGAHALALHAAEVVRIPTGADQLLMGTDGATAWRVGSALAIGVRVDATAAEVAAWLTPGGPGRDLADAAGVAPDDLAADVERRAPFLRAGGGALLLRWVDGVRTAAAK
jgi:GMP synthase (glutamine-hydrolysing)